MQITNEFGQPISLGTVLEGGSTRTVVKGAAGVFYAAQLLGIEVGVADLLDGWEDWEFRICKALQVSGQSVALVEEDLVFKSPIPNPPKIVCIGTNYHDHLREMGVSSPPEFPYAFLRPNTCLAGHREQVPMPAWATFIDWEAELGIVIRQGGRDLEGPAAQAAIGGYTIINDISARDWIEDRPWVGIDWVMQKGWDKFQPTGPWLVPSKYVPEPNNLEIQLSVNGIVRQSSNTSQMIFDPVAIVEHLSRIMTLQSGDVIATGTPAGVGFGQKPRIKLSSGDIMRVDIKGIGCLENQMK